MKMKSLRVFILASFFIVSFSFKTDEVHADFVPPEVEVIQIPGFSDQTNTKFTLQPVPLTTINIMNFVDKTKNRPVTDLLKQFYPNYPLNQLQNVTATLEQCATYSKNQGFKIKIANSPLDYPTLKNELINNRPVLANLTANGNYWIEQKSAIIIYGVQRIKYPNLPENIIYFYRSLNHGNDVLFSGQLNSIALLQKESITDPSANITYSWTKTLYGFLK